jgi:PAS domain S-box-containing protein
MSRPSEHAKASASLRTELSNYGFALMITAVVVAVRGMLDPVMHERAPLPLLIGAVAIAAWRGGWRPATLAAVVGWAASAYYFIPLRRSFDFEHPLRELVAALLYAVTCAIIIVVVERWRHAKRKLVDTFASEELLAAIVTSSDDAIISVDLDGIISSWNPGAERLYGWTATEVIGKSMDLLIPEQARSVETRTLDAIRRGKRVVAHETTRCRKDGTILDVLVSVSPIRDASGTLVGASKVASDISARVRAERAAQGANEALRASEQRLSAVLESIDDHLVSYDSQWRYTYVNDAAARTLGKSRDELIGRCIWELFPEAIGNQYYRELHDAVAQNRVIRSEHYFEPMERWFENHIYPTDDGVTVFSSNVTLRKRAEQALKESDRRKDEFLAVLAHELRNPLAPIRNASRILEGRNDGHPESRLALDIIGRQLDHLVRLVDDLLDISRINRGHIELQKDRVSLAWVIDNAVESVRPLIETQQHRLTVLTPETPITLDADFTRLTQVFLNLLTNAARYTPSGGDIRVEAGVVGKRAVVSVRDNGIGIPPEMLGRIFDMFTQVDRSLERATGGLGIGLTLVKRLVELHGGTVEARSAGEGSGTEFVVSLPLAATAQPHSADRPVAKHDSTSGARRILVVDDNTDSADTLAMLFRFRNHEVCVAYDGQAALDLVESFAPDTVLLDIGLPIINGYDVAKHLRSLPGGDELLLIAISGWGQDEDRRMSAASGFNHHLVKPVDYSVLIPLVEGVRVPG